MKILESIVPHIYISELIFGGAEKLLMEEAKYCRKFHQKFQQHFLKLS